MRAFPLRRARGARRGHGLPSGGSSPRGRLSKPEACGRAGFRDANLAGRWRDNDLRLVGFRAWVKEAKGGDRISVPGATTDYVVLVQPK